MSFANDDMLGLARTLGQLRLQAEERSITSGMELVDRAEFERVQRDAIRFGTQLSVAKAEIEALNETVHKLRVAARTAGEQPAPVRKAVTSSTEVALREEVTALESQLRAAHVQGAELKGRIARLEAASKAAIGADELAQAKEQAADYKRHIERLEAEARGYAMQIAELQRGISNKDAYIGALTREIDHLKAQPAKVVEVAAQPSECPTCAPIIRAIAQAVQASNEPKAMPATRVAVKPSEMLPHVPRFLDKPAGKRTRSVRGYTAGIVNTLGATDRPLNVAEIGERIGLSSRRVATNVWHLVRDEIVVKLGTAGRGANNHGYRYWLKDRPLPQGVGA